MKEIPWPYICLMGAQIIVIAGVLLMCVQATRLVLKKAESKSQPLWIIVVWVLPIIGSLIVHFKFEERRPNQPVQCNTSTGSVSSRQLGVADQWSFVKEWLAIPKAFSWVSWPLQSQ
jgi:beta-lactamase regulating signal transducer with metallopeptidase domain